MSSAWPDLAGRIDGDRHILPVRVYFEDTDAGGVIYHASYLKFCERGRSDFIRLLGIKQSDLADPTLGQAAIFVVRRMEIDYLRPGRLDDVLEVVTRCTEIGGAKLVLHQKVMRGDVVLAEARVVVVLVSAAGKPQRIGAMIRDALSGVAPSGG